MTAWERTSERLIVVVGPSGAGKDSVLRAWLAALPAAERPSLVRRTITRAPGDATEGHEPIDEQAFLEAQARGVFALSWQAHGLHYGVRGEQLEPLRQGRWVVMNGSRAHLPELRIVAPRARVIEIAAAPALRRVRLAAREREHGEAARDRLARQVPDAGAELIIANEGPLSAAVDALQRWWREASRNAIAERELRTVLTLRQPSGPSLPSVPEGADGPAPG